MAPDKTWAQEVCDRVSATHETIKSVLTGMGYNVLDEAPLLRDYKDMEAAGRSLRARGINALVIYTGTWTYANCAVAAALEADVPVVVLPDAEPGTCGLVGGAIARGGMGAYSIYANMVYGPIDQPQTRDKLKLYLDAACAAKGLRGQVLGLGGGRSMGMVTAVCDPNDFKMRFGIEVDSFEQMNVIAMAETISDEKAYEFFDWIKQTYGEIVANEVAMIKQIKLYLAMVEFCRMMNYDFVAVKCLPELPAQYTTFCLAHALLGDAMDAYGKKERFVFACEADIMAALTMQIMLMLTDLPVMFTDLTQYDFKSDVLTTCNCGSQPTDFAKDKKDVRWEIEGVHEFKWKYGGCCPQHVGKPGRVTMARISMDNGQYEMLIVPAEAVDMPREKLRETIWERPHTYFNLLCDKEDFFAGVRSNHIHVVYGEWEEHLAEVCRVLGIRPKILGSLS